MDGFIFQNEIETALTEKIQWCVENKSVLKEIGKKARGIYEQVFSMEVFERKLLKLVENILVKQ